ncbi:MAG: flagellar biosynthesis protein FlgH [Deltaproteobacteria bacterium HGW-Deltaproteobacteria-7]|jgi:flagellar L-ring protein precursor FlgH|nr:MAG: flagellar biosynthesis protein FlgH [Deltaproteobacteria bacterium HGW-Deltaproteobacteria-7]PKN20768.1 MAG: flagellar biosynthesis protein FlgH [Deltaproteobacteria bacterium HGW-Deltaproteobacteria-6]
MKKQYSILILSVATVVFLITGCVPPKEVVRPDVMETPIQQIRQPAPAPGSIWRGESDKNMIFTDKKARYVNDIVTIIVAEAASGGNKASTATSRDTSTDASITSFLGIENAIIGNNASMGGKIGLGGTTANALKGSGDTSRNNTLIAKISARVIRVLDNGNLLIEGRRQVTINAEDQYLIIGGIIRPEDITPENTIASQYISDARIVYTGEGVINDKMRPGWMTRLVDWVWPF